MSRILPVSGADRGDRALIAALALAAVLVGLRLDDVPVGAATDDAYYVEMARSLAAGRGPVLALGPDGTTVRPDIFPPGFPLLLAPFAWAWPDSLGALKAVSVVAAFALVLLAWWWPPAGTHRGLRVALVAVVALNPWLTGWAGRLLSDLPYAALALAALLAAARSLEADRRDGIVLAGLLSGAAVAVRTVGWAGVLAVAAVCVAERRWRHLGVYLGATLAVLGPVWLLTGTAPLSGAYAAQMSGGDDVAPWRFALENALRYVAELPVLLVPIFGAPVRALLARWHLAVLYPAAAFAVGTGLLLLAGWATTRLWRDRSGRIRSRLAVFFVLLTAAALVNFHGYPSPVQTRLLLPLLPLLAWLVLAAVWPRPRAAGMLVAAILVAAVLHNGWRVARPLGRTLNPDGSGLVDPSVGAAWIKDHTAPDAVVMTPDPLQRHVHLNRPVVTLPDSTRDPAAAARRAGAAALLIGPRVHGRPRRLDQAGRRHLAAARRRPDVLQPVFVDSLAAVYLFRVLPPERGRD